MGTVPQRRPTDIKRYPADAENRLRIGRFAAGIRMAPGVRASVSGLERCSRKKAMA